MSAPVAHPEAVSHSTRNNKSMSASVAHTEAVNHSTRKNKSMSALDLPDHVFGKKISKVTLYTRQT